MKHLLLTTIAAVVLVGCGESQQSAPAPEVKLVEPVAEVAQPKPPTVKTPDISIHAAARQGKIEAIKQHLTDGVGVNAKSEMGRTTLHSAAREGHTEVIELLIAKGADVNVKDKDGTTPLDMADDKETADLLRKHGGKASEELETEGKFITPLSSGRSVALTALQMPWRWRQRFGDISRYGPKVAKKFRLISLRETI